MSDPYSTSEQTTIEFPASATTPVEEASTDAIAEDAAPEYSIATGWIDAAGKTRTWVLSEPSGVKIAAVTTKSGAKKLADLLNRAEAIERSR